MRLGDLDKFKENWNENSAIGNTMRIIIDEIPTVDPETLPIVKELRAENKKLTEALGDSFAIDLMNKLEKVERERDAAVKDLRGCAIESYAECMYCSHNNKGTLCWNCTNGLNWEWRGLKDENNS